MEIHETGSLFTDVQTKPVFPDSKTFPDCTPLRDLQLISKEYEELKQNSQFDLDAFVKENFELPPEQKTSFKTDLNKSASEHIQSLWSVLTRQPDVHKGSLLALPHLYIVPGGRFGEIYYWDSYFTMLGLAVDGKQDLIRSMIDNFTYLINEFGYIPNGNRSYYLGRSQPPFFALMVDLLSNLTGKEILVTYSEAIEKEYLFWMKGSDLLAEDHRAERRVVRLPDGSVLNRYWDENCTPRPEAYKEDLELSHGSSTSSKDLFRHIRAAAESGWDFSSRWFSDPQSFHSIHTTEIIPVDLNCLLWNMEKILAEACQLNQQLDKAKWFEVLAIKRKAAIEKYCWNEKHRFYFDYDFVIEEQKPHFTLAGMFPLFFKLSTAEQAKAISEVLRNKFLKPGGLTTTLYQTGQQWDAPNGWAPLQWISYQGCRNYNFTDLAEKIRANWIQTNDKVFKATGKMMEKYNVEGIGEAGGGGEYPNQDGFGWTNGVYLAMKKNN